MIIKEFEIIEFQPHKSSLRDLEEIHRLRNMLKKEMHPSDNLTELSETLEEFNNPQPMFTTNYWIAKEIKNSKIVGFAKAKFKEEGDNDHIVWFDILILPIFRRKGLGKKILDLIAKSSLNKNKKILMSNTIHTVPDAELFMKSQCGSVGSNLLISQVNVERIDDKLIDNWIVNAPFNKYKLDLWNGAYPEQELPSIVKVKESINSSPRDQLKINDTHWTVEQLRQIEQFYHSRNVERWTAFAKDNQTNQIIGLTEVFWHHSERNIMHQGDTGVLKEFRGQGIAKWLKAFMIMEIKKGKKQVEYIRVSNASTNDAIISINGKLGFEIYQSRKTWQIELTHL